MSSASVTLKLTRSRNSVARGVSLPEALLGAKAIGQFDHAMLLAADSTGPVAHGLKYIAEHRVNQLQSVDSLKASLVFPKVIVFIGVCDLRGFSVDR
jgi:type II secretory pathway component PulF